MGSKLGTQSVAYPMHLRAIPLACALIMLALIAGVTSCTAGAVIGLLTGNPMYQGVAFLIEVFLWIGVGGACTIMFGVFMRRLWFFTYLLSLDGTCLRVYDPIFRRGRAIQLEMTTDIRASGGRADLATRMWVLRDRAGHATVLANAHPLWSQILSALESAAL